MSMRCLLTGAGGALGRAMLSCLQTKKCQIISCQKSNGDCQFDVRDSTRFSQLISHSKPDLIIHLAASFSNDFEEAYAINVEAVRRLLDFIEDSRCRTRVVLIGSAAEYGIVRPEESPITEQHVLSPVSNYGMTKAWQTQLATLYASRGVDVLVARVFNLYGPGLSERLFVGRVQKQIGEVLAGDKSVIEVGPLTAVRDYISTADAANQIMAIAEHGLSGQVYHVASGKSVTMREILMHYLDEYHLDASIVRESSAASNRAGYDVPLIYADIEKTLKLMKMRGSGG
jgi:nucleoside-diphosphate-sugar epimerase